MIDLRQLSNLPDPKVIVIGNHPGLVQSILDFDYLAGKATPSVLAVLGTQQKQLRYFWGGKQINLPGFVGFEELPKRLKNQINLFVVAQSGRRAVAVSQEALTQLPNALGGMIFAEGVPERHSLQLRQFTTEHNKFVLGPASVGLAIGGRIKLGAIGGTLPEQIAASGLVSTGNIAVISTSGGMVNELINMIAANGGGVSFAAAVGGERYPATTPAELVTQALKDRATKAIVYFGELGGTDEYEIAELLAKNKSKPFIAYVAGTIAEQFETAPQFGHAKSMAQTKSETASAKKLALRRAGAKVPDSFASFEAAVAKLPKLKLRLEQIELTQQRLEKIRGRSASLFIDRISSDKDGVVKLLDQPLLQFISKRSLSEIALSLFLGQPPRSKQLADFFDTCLRLLVDHGPQVSGAVNTMITARAGKDLTASLASGLLTIGPRFGGAINQAASNWFSAVNSQRSPAEYVEFNAKQKVYIAGIGHKKYRTDNPDPRVEMLIKNFDVGGPYLKFAQGVAQITTQKKAQLILNVDGTIAALLLDLLTTQEKYSRAQIEELLSTDFCNAIFVLSRSIGLIAHHLEQQRLDEGLFRLPTELIDTVY